MSKNSISCCQAHQSKWFRYISTRLRVDSANCFVQFSLKVRLTKHNCFVIKIQNWHRNYLSTITHILNLYLMVSNSSLPTISAYFWTHSIYVYYTLSQEHIFWTTCGVTPFIDIWLLFWCFVKGMTENPISSTTTYVRRFKSLMESNVKKGWTWCGWEGARKN